MMDEDNEPKAKGPWRRRFIGFLVLVVIVGGAYYSKPHWYPKLQPYIQKYVPWYKGQPEIKPLTPIQKLQIQMDQLMAQNQRLQDQQQVMHLALENAGSVNDNWVLADASYLTRLANYQLQINQNVQTAIKLLQTADRRIASLANPQYQPARQILANNILQLQSLPDVDIGGLIARLIATAQQVPNLNMEQPKLVESKMPLLASSSQSVWRTALDRTWYSLKELIVIRRLKNPIEPLLTEDQRINLNQHIAALLQQAQWAVLHHDQKVYQLSLVQAQDMVSRYFIINQAATKAILVNLAQLADVNVEPSYPDLGSSVMVIEHLSHSKNSSVE